MKKTVFTVVLAVLAGGVNAAERSGVSQFSELEVKASDIAAKAAMEPADVKPVAFQVRAVAFENTLGASKKRAAQHETCAEPVIQVLRYCVVAPPKCVKMQTYVNDDAQGYSAWYVLRAYKLAIFPNGQTKEFVSEESDRILAGNVPSENYPDTPESWTLLKTRCEQGVGVLLAQISTCR